MSKKFNIDEQVSRWYIFLAPSTVVAVGCASALCLVFKLPLWPILVGWVTYLTRGVTARAEILNLISLWLGAAVGSAAITAAASFNPSYGSVILPIAVTLVVAVLIILQFVFSFNNPIASCLDLISFLVANVVPAVHTVVQMGTASAVGSLIGWVSLLLQKRISRAKPSLAVAPSTNLTDIGYCHEIDYSHYRCIKRIWPPLFPSSGAGGPHGLRINARNA